MNIIIGFYLGFCYALGFASIMTTPKEEVEVMDFVMFLIAPVIIPIIIVNQITDRWI